MQIYSYLLNTFFVHGFVQVNRQKTTAKKRIHSIGIFFFAEKKCVDLVVFLTREKKKLL